MSSCFRAHAAAIGAPLGFAWLAALGVVFKLFVVEKELFARGKDEFFFAIYTLEHSIRKFHGRLPYAGKSDGISHPHARAVLFPCLLNFLDCNRHSLGGGCSETWLRAWCPQGFAGAKNRPNDPPRSHAGSAPPLPMTASPEMQKGPGRESVRR
jgi:hypothetical protein